ncbi:protein Allo37 [Lake sturgeon herpesvirus]|nr:protein Allo37 [Lake sturgeon herpesvirus]
MEFVRPVKRKMADQSPGLIDVYGQCLELDDSIETNALIWHMKKNRATLGTKRHKAALQRLPHSLKKQYETVADLSQVDFVCLTKDEFFLEMIEINEKDGCFDQALEQMVNNLNIQRALDNCLMELLTPTDSMTVDAKGLHVIQRSVALLTDYYAAPLELYLRTLYKNFIRWYTLMGVVPHTFIPTSHLYGGGLTRYVEIPSSDLSFINNSQIEKFKRYEDTLEQMSTFLEAKDFMAAIQKVGVPGKLGGQLFSLTGVCDAPVIYGLLRYVRQFHYGYLPYVPEFNGDVNVVYDPCYNFALGGDKYFRLYECIIVEPPGVNLPPNSIGRRMTETSQMFRAAIKDCFKACLTSTQRVVVTAKDNPRVYEAVNKERARYNTFIEPLLTNTQNIVNLAKAHNSEYIDPVAQTKRVLEDENATTFEEVLAYMKTKTGDKEMMDQCITNINLGNFDKARKIVQKMDKTDHDVMIRLINSLDDKKVGGSSHSNMIKLVEAQTGHRIIHAYDSKAHVGMLEDFFHVWVAYWTSCLTGVNCLYSAKTIRYTGNKTVNANEHRPFTRMLADWNSLVNAPGYLLADIVYQGPALAATVDEAMRLSEIMHPVSACNFLGRQTQSRPTYFNMFLFEQIKKKQDANQQAIKEVERGEKGQLLDQDSLDGEKD